MRFLLVEDDDIDAMIITRWLKSHDVVRVRRASEAMAMVRDGFDAILCDMGLPDATVMTGSTTTVTEILTETKIPLVKISGNARPGVIDKTEAAILEAVEKVCPEIRSSSAAER